MRPVHDSPQTKRWAARRCVEARRPCTTAWCDQISTPAENQLRFTVPSTDTVLLPLSLVSTNRHDADRSPLPERRGNNADSHPMIASKLELSPSAVSVLGQLFVEGPTSDNNITTTPRRPDLLSPRLAFHDARLPPLTPDGGRMAREWDLCSLYARRDRRWYLKVRTNTRPEAAAVSHSESGAAVRQDRSAPATPDRARILWRRYPLHRSPQWEGLLATLLSPATGLLRYAVAAYRQCFISGRGSIWNSWNSHKHRTI